MDASKEVVLAFSAEAGRVANFKPLEGETDAISHVKVLSQGEHGHVSVNADNSLSLVLSRDPGQTDALRFEYEITFNDGRTQVAAAEVTVTPGTQLAGWGQGNFYMLEEAVDGSVVVEHGDNHRKVHITGSSDGLSRADIAAIEGVTVDKITAKWLAQNEEYGATPEKALSTGLGMELWYEITGSTKAPQSNWLLFERGYEYGGTGRLISRGGQGESELHPMYVGAYGEGDAPRILDKPNMYQATSHNVVVQGLNLDGGFQALQGKNLLLNDVAFTGAEMNIQNVDGFTFRNSSITDVAREATVDGGSIWAPHLNRTSGAFISKTEGVLIENTFTDMIGWAKGYDWGLSAGSPMPPSMYSHNYYIQYSSSDVTFRDNVVMRAASFGAQIRPGGVIEDNVFIDNNGAFNALGGTDASANYSLVLSNIITSAGHKRVAQQEGALSMGMEVSGKQSTVMDNIVAHLADPNNPEEIALKNVAHDGSNVKAPTYDNTIVFNWISSSKGNGRNPDANIEGLDRPTLNATTIQNFTAQILGQEKATIGDLANLLRAQASGQLDHVVDADLIIAFFRQGFGLEVDVRSLGTTLRFQPNDLGDGMRWDNRLNWSTGDLPGTGASDSVDLGGNDVIFGAKTLTVDDFDFGDFGRLTATSGRLSIDGEINVSATGAQVKIERAGQVWIEGYSDEDLLEILLSGGRFANTGEVSGSMSVVAGGNGQALLATAGGSFDLKEGSSVTVLGTKGKVGFDGATSDTAVLRMHEGAALKFVATAEGLGRISEFRSGAFGETSAVTSGVRLDGTLNVDLTNWKGAAGGRWTLIKADQIIGAFDGFTVSGLGATQNAVLRVDYARDQVVLSVGAPGSGTGQYVMEVAGEEKFLDASATTSMNALWNALTLERPAMPEPTSPMPAPVPAPVPQPAPIQAAPVKPAPTKPAPTKPEPVKPEPGKPAPETPEFSDPVTIRSAVSHKLAAGDANLLLTGSGNVNGTGNGLANKITGNAGNNVLDGGRGADTLRGGAGNDTYIVDNAGDRVIEATRGGIDTVRASISYALGANVENLVLTGSGHRDGTGNALNNRITGNAGNNVLDGGRGADTLRGGAGNDTYIVDNAGDRVIEAARGGIDTVRASVSYALGANVENLVLTGLGHRGGTGNALNNRITGNAGNNVLDGGRGADTLRGGAGNDTYIVDNAKDVVIESKGGGTDTVRASVSWMLGEHVENLALTGKADLSGTGNALNNRITGNAGNNVLDGGAGDDWLAGGLGKDVLTGGSGADHFVFLSRHDTGAYANQRDVITDFSRTQNDRIDLSAIDADETLLGNQAFSFIGQSKFTGAAGQLRFEKQGQQALIFADIDGDKRPDFSIELSSFVSLIEQDFLL